ncbi:MAG: GGDEF domain-containing protein, partial [Bellilinea sp.]
MGYPPGKPPASFPADHPLVRETQLAVQFVNHIEDDRQLEWLGENRQGIAWMSIPLRWNDRTIGFLWLIRAAPFIFKSSEVALAETFAGPAALSIQNSRLYSKTQRLATLDSLTGLLNRRSIFEAGERELVRAQRYREPFSLLVIDLDNFKQVNDTCGHLIGDGLLKQVARRMKHALRVSDLIGRPGGDEFVVLLIKTTPGEAVMIAERLLKTLRDRPFRLDGQSHRITASIGAAGIDNAPTTFQNLFQRADQAMYAAKQNGGNQVQTG